MIYLASPYSTGEGGNMEDRYRAARIATEVMLLEGLVVFSPIVYGRRMEKSIGTNYHVWKKLNDNMIRKADMVFVLMLEGWEKSAGVKHEISLASRLGKPIQYISPDEVRHANRRHETT